MDFMLTICNLLKSKEQEMMKMEIMMLERQLRK